MNNDLKIIKKTYGEKMMHFCRAFFSTILETEGLLPEILQTNFASSHMLYEDLVTQGRIEDFKNYIYNIIHKKNEEIENLEVPTPEELMTIAGYKLYECKTEEEIQAFKKYYAKGEALCTFRGNRLDSCYVFFAVKENVSDIKRENFKKPKRQDEYGTSVISIQFSKDEAHTLSIKNRYNHTVANPDATFGNNLDNIISGLTKSFEQTYGLKQKHKSDGFEMPGYVRANDGRWYKYNYEINNIYYCPDNIIIDNGKVKKYEKEKYIIMDYFILDLVEKRIYLYDHSVADSFPEVISDIDKINLVKTANGKKIEIIHRSSKKTIIELNERNTMIELDSDKIIDAKNQFFCRGKFLLGISLPNLETCGDYFLSANRCINMAIFPKLKLVGNFFLLLNSDLLSFSAPELSEVGDLFLQSNVCLTDLEIPSLIKAGSYFLERNSNLTKVYMPNLKIVDVGFLYGNNKLIEIDFPSLESVGAGFLSLNNSIINVNLPQLERIDRKFLSNNNHIVRLALPKVKSIGDDFLNLNIFLQEITAPNLQKIGDYFLVNNEDLKILDLPLLQQVGSSFLESNCSLINANLPELQTVGKYFLASNPQLQSKILEQLEESNNRR